MVDGGTEASSVFVTAPDGLKLHVRCHGPRIASGLPVVCLPGLTRTVADFEDVAVALASDPDSPRRILALDSRGRGLSDYDQNPLNYSLATELADLRAVLVALEVPPAMFIGTSRGGILTMLLATVQPTAIAGAVLNDIGPVIDPIGLSRIKSYVGKLPQIKSFEEGAAVYRRLFGQHFTKLSDQEWLDYAHRSFKIEQHRVVPTYDIRIAKTMDALNFDEPLADLWPAFDAMARIPLMVLRGANSDLLSEQTVAAMRARRPIETVTVPDQGHAPILSGASLIGRIAGFVAACETARPAPASQ
jgi:pimeloyl-ACP methyl ester carboxylesterase